MSLPARGLLLLCLSLAVPLAAHCDRAQARADPHAAAGDGCTARIEPGEELQKALDRALRDGRPATVCLAAGEYRLASTLTITRDDVTLRGAGNATVLVLQPGTQAPVLLVGDPDHPAPARTIHNVTIERLKIVGAGGQGSEFATGRSYLTNNGVTVRSGRGVIVRELDVSNCRSAGILTEYSSEDVTIENNTVSTATWDGISLNRALRTRVVGNTLHDNVAAGITVEHMVDSTIENNTMRQNGTHGIYLSDAYRNRIDGNHFVGNKGAGVFLTCSIRSREPLRCWDDSMSQNNTFENNEFIGNGYAYMVAPDVQAHCNRPGLVANLSRGDLFERNPSNEPDWNTYGRCLQYVDARSR